MSIKTKKLIEGTEIKSINEKQFINKNPTNATMYQNFIIPYLYEA